MDTERWQILCKAIDSGSLRGAAEQMGYTVSGISRSVATLEAELGFSLLYRAKTGVKPTAECEKLMPAVRELLFAQERVEQTAARIKGAEYGTIVIGTAYSSYYRWISTVTQGFRQKHPGVQFCMVNGSSSQLHDMLMQNRLDFCIISAREGGHDWYPLCNDPMMAMVPAAHPLAKQKTVPLKALETEPFIDTFAGQDNDNARMFERCGIHPNTQYQSMDIDATYAMVAAGLGITTNNNVNCRAGDKDIRFLPLDPPQTVEIGLACGKTMPPAGEAFLQYILPHLPKE